MGKSIKPLIEQLVSTRTLNIKQLQAPISELIDPNSYLYSEVFASYWYRQTTCETGCVLSRDGQCLCPTSSLIDYMNRTSRDIVTTIVGELVSGRNQQNSHTGIKTVLSNKSTSVSTGPWIPPARFEIVHTMSLSDLAKFKYTESFLPIVELVGNRITNIDRIVLDYVAFDGSPVVDFNISGFLYDSTKLSDKTPSLPTNNVIFTFNTKTNNLLVGLVGGFAKFNLTNSLNGGYVMSKGSFEDSKSFTNNNAIGIRIGEDFGWSPGSETRFITLTISGEITPQELEQPNNRLMYTREQYTDLVKSYNGGSYSEKSVLKFS